MLTLFGFLLTALISLLYANPRTKIGILNYAIIIPLTLVAFCFLINYSSELTDNYFFSLSNVIFKTLKSCVVPGVISGVIIYFQLKKKMENGGKLKFPKILFFSTLIVLGIGLFQYYLKTEIERILPQREKFTRDQQMTLAFIKAYILEEKERLPAKFWEKVIWENIDYNDNLNTINYTYKYSNLDVTDLSSDEIQKFGNTWKEYFSNTYWKDSEGKDLYLEINANLEYILIDLNEKVITTFTISPDEYK